MGINMANLAIKGHPTRGKEVIQLLEMLGANRLGYKDTFVGFYYYIECGAICSSDEYPTYSTIFTLEEFEEKYPYKVGDKVLSYNKWVGVIESMEWYRGEVLYHVRERNNCLSSETVEHLQYYIDMSDLKKCGTATIKCIQENGSRDMELIIPYNQEIVNIDGRYILRDKKPQYPKTYKECCDVVNASPYVALVYDSFNGQTYSHDIDNLQIYENLRKLKICRDAYWKIAGEQIGLDKSWRPDWNINELKYIIYYENDRLWFNDEISRNTILAFPTEEMRNEFYDNFKDLIEQCKEIL